MELEVKLDKRWVEYVWGEAYNAYFSSLMKLQNYAVCLIMSAPYRAHTD